MKVWNRRECMSRFGIASLSLLVTPRILVSGLLAEEPRITISPLNMLRDEDEIALGRQFAAALEKEQAIVSNAMIDSYLGKMVSSMAAQSQRPSLPWSIRLVNSHEPNAYALPGGFLYVSRGLIELIGSENELAAVVAHEIGHVVGRHATNRLLLIFTAHTVLKPVLDNLDKQNRIIEKIIVDLGGATALLTKLRFSLKEEEQADLLGFYDMLRAGWDPKGFLKLFARLEELEKSSGGSPISFLSTHPPAPERAEAIRHELTLVTVPAGAVSDSTKFQIFKSAMGLLPEPPKAA
jgi:predicted Zn-dependent protease